MHLSASGAYIWHWVFSVCKWLCLCIFLNMHAMLFKFPMICFGHVLFMGQSVCLRVTSGHSFLLPCVTVLLPIFANRGHVGRHVTLHGLFLFLPGVQVQPAACTPIAVAAEIARRPSWINHHQCNSVITHWIELSTRRL